MITVDLQKRTQKHRISSKKLTATAEAILREIGFKEISLSIVLVSDTQIRSMNKKFLNHDYSTDVISFGLLDKKTMKRILSSKSKKRVMPPAILGDIIISLDTAKKQGKQLKHSFFYEVAFYLCHGILHLIGDDDKTKKQREAMHEKQAKILKGIGL